MSKQSYWEKPLNSSLASLMMVSLCTATSLYPIMGSAVAVEESVGESVCYGIADNDRYNGSKDEFASVKVEDSFALTVAGAIINADTNAQTLHIEASTFSNSGSTLYATDSGLFGTLDIDSQGFIPIGQVGVCNGVEGPIAFNDVDGLTYDFATHKYFGTQRREHTTPAKNDLLFQVNVISGECVKGAFNGDDYVVVTVNGCPECYDVDDIAGDPGSAELYIIANQGDGVKGALAILERGDGAMPTGVANLIGWNEVDDIESLDFDKKPTVVGGNEFRLFGTTGNGGLNKSPATMNSIYTIDKNSGAAGSPLQIGPAEKDPPQDYEAVACRIEGITTTTGGPACLLYAMHDEGQFHSQLVEINPISGAIRPLGELHKRADIEGLLIKDGQLYGTSGSDQAPGIPNGAIYKIDRITGALELMGETCYGEISSMALRNNGEVWAWARGSAWAAPPETTGPVIINLNAVGNTACANGKNGREELASLYEEFPFPFGRKVQGIAWSVRDGKEVLYLVNGKGDLYFYDPAATTAALDENVQLACEDVLGRKPESMEAQPNGLLLFSVHGRNDIGIAAYDPMTCEQKSSRGFTNVPYDDIEAIEWPQEECSNASYLYANSGDEELELVEEMILTQEQADTLAERLGAVIESGSDGSITAYDSNGNPVFIAQQMSSTSRSSAVRSGNDPCVDLDGIKLCPTTFVNQETFIAELEARQEIEKVVVNKNGTVEVTAVNGSTLNLQLSFTVSASYGDGALEGSYELESIVPVTEGDRDGYKLSFRAGSVTRTQTALFN